MTFIDTTSMTTDAMLVDDIRAVLERDRRIPHAGQVAVAAQGGTVTLRGTVATPHQRRTAVALARSVRGVRAVEDGLRLDPRDRSRDDRIRGVALQALMRRDDVPALRIDVHVTCGWLTLTGAVRRQAESDAAYDAVACVPGVGGITNEIKVIAAGMNELKTTRRTPRR
jgi:osmotically-inducible protein OsmY